VNGTGRWAGGWSGMGGLRWRAVSKLCLVGPHLDGVEVATHAASGIQLLLGAAEPQAHSLANRLCCRVRVRWAVVLIEIDTAWGRAVRMLELIPDEHGNAIPDMTCSLPILVTAHRLPGHFVIKLHARTSPVRVNLGADRRTPYHKHVLRGLQSTFADLIAPILQAAILCGCLPCVPGVKFALRCIMLVVLCTHTHITSLLAPMRAIAFFLLSAGLGIPGDTPSHVRADPDRLMPIQVGATRRLAQSCVIKAGAFNVLPLSVPNQGAELGLLEAFFRFICVAADGMASAFEGPAGKLDNSATLQSLSVASGHQRDQRNNGRSREDSHGSHG